MSFWWNQENHRSGDKLLDRYGIDEVDEEIYIDLLETIGKKRGCLVRGGVVDYEKVYSVVMNDIKTGAITSITFDRFNM